MMKHISLSIAPPMRGQSISTQGQDISRTEIRARLARLTSRERQVMQLIVWGSRSREMAEQLGISARTIEVHRAHLMLKMGTNRVPELVRWALSTAQICK